MNLVIYHLVSGDGWFSCGLYFVIVALLDALRLFDERPLLRRMAHFFMVLAIPLAAMTGTPVRLWFATILIAAVCGHAMLAFTNRNLTLRRISTVLASCLVMAGLAFELPWYRGPNPPADEPLLNLYILGDSLSAGGYGESRPWPKILADSSPARIHDLSRDGATVSTTLAEDSDALAAAPQEDTRIFIELGGNDMLGGNSASEFETSLDRLLAVCRGDGAHPRTVVMMELPIMFGKWSFGAAQRRLASRHGVVLVPKRVLAGIVLTRPFTGSDGLHLSQEGHDHFARVVRPWLGFE